MPRNPHFHRLRFVPGIPYMLAVLAAVPVPAGAQTPGSRNLYDDAGNPPSPPRDLRGIIDPDPFARDRDSDDAAAGARRDRRGRELSGAEDDQDARARDGEGDNDLRAGDQPQNRNTAEQGRRPGDDRGGRFGREVLPDALRARELLRVRQAEERERLAEEERRTQDAGAGDPATPGPYDPLGIRAGSFLLYPEVSIEGLFSDNALLSSTDSRSDRAVVISPQITARSTWSRHLLEGTVHGINSFYSEFPPLDDKEFGVSLRGRFDVWRATNVEVTADYLDTLEDIDSTDTPAGAAERTPEKLASGTAQLSHRFNRLTATLRGGVTDDDYEDVRLINGTIANNDDRDFTERELVGHLSYELRPGVAGFIEGTGNEREFDSPIDDNGIRSGSSGYTATAGISLELSGKLTGEIGVGFARQTPDDQTLEDISGLILNGGLVWRPTGLTIVRFDAITDVEETTQVDSAGSLVRTAIVSVEHAFRQNMIAGLALGYELEEFSGNGQEDEEYLVGLSGEYRLNRSAALIANYRFIKSVSTVPDRDYIENEFRLGMRFRR